MPSCPFCQVDRDRGFIGRRVGVFDYYRVSEDNRLQLSGDSIGAIGIAQDLCD
jgi:hypothetical protein